MNTLTIIIISAIAIAFIASILIMILKNSTSPSKIVSIQKYIKDGKYQQAQKIAKSILSKDARNFVVHYWLGKAYFADGKTELAFMEYQTVNKNMVFNGDISEVEFRKEMAILYSKYNQTEEALKEYLLLSKLDPRNSENYYNIAKNYETIGQLSLAMGFYQKAIKINKNHGPSLTAMGHLLYQNKQYADAKTVIEASIKLNPENYENYYYLGKILKSTKNLPAAVKAFEKSQSSPDFKQKSLIERGSCLMLAGQTEQAINELELAVKSSKDDSSAETLFARYLLAACYEKNRKIEKAIDQWERVFKINNRYKDVVTKLNQYKDLQTNDGMKEYLTSSAVNFVELCKKITQYGINLHCQKCEPTKYGCSMLATERKDDNWMNVRNQNYLILFYRENNPIEESVIRKVVDTVKSQGYMKGIVITSSTFTPAAVKYAENRTVVLVTKDKLENILKKPQFNS